MGCLFFFFFFKYLFFTETFKYSLCISIWICSFCIPGSSAVTTSSSPTSYKSTGNVNKRFPFWKNDLNQRLHCEEVFARRNHQFALSNYEPVGEKNLFSSLMVFPPRNQFAISYDKSGER